MQRMDVADFLCPERMSDLMDASEALGRRLDDQYVIAVGQSAAWLAYTLGLLQNAAGKPCTSSFVAFSGYFLQKGAAADVHQRYIMPETYDNGWSMYPDEARWARYKRYMDEVGHSPRHITERFNRTGKKTAFVDFSSTGRGFASFMHALMKIGDCQSAADAKALQEAVTFVSYGTMIHTQKYVVPLDRDQDVDIPLTRLTLPRVAWDFMGTMGEMDVKPDSLRLVPSFNIGAQGSGRLKYPCNQVIVNDMKRRIGRFVYENTVISAP